MKNNLKSNALISGYNGSGSLGGFVTFGTDTVFALTANHVVIADQQEDPFQAVCQKGSLNVFGFTYAWKRLSVSSINYVDVALLKIDTSNYSPVWQMPPAVNKPQGFQLARQGMDVYVLTAYGTLRWAKVTRPITQGVRLSGGIGTFSFDGLIEVTPQQSGSFSQSGDSGGMVFTADHEAVGIISGNSPDEEHSYLVPFLSQNTGCPALRNFYPGMRLW